MFDVFTAVSVTITLFGNVTTCTVFCHDTYVWSLECRAHYHFASLLLYCEPKEIVWFVMFVYYAGRLRNGVILEMMRLHCLVCVRPVLVVYFQTSVLLY